MNTMQELVEQYVPYANKLACQKKKTLPNFIDLDEIKSAAYMGLVEAATRYKPEMGVKFTTFSYTRIFGAIHDYLREQGWMKKDGEYQTMQNLDYQIADSDGKKCTIMDSIAAKCEDTTEECFEVVTLKLDDQAKKILRTYFIEEYSMKEVGDQIGVSESRVCQLIKQYKSSMKNSWNEYESAELAA